MKEEIDSAAEFLGRLLKIGCSDITRKQLDLFRVKMEKLLHEHFRGHWFPQKPYKGSGYRCLRINHKMDPVIAKAAELCGLQFSDLQSYFPNELTMWIDPREVSYRIGENGSICVLYGSDIADESSSCSSSDSDLDVVVVTTQPTEKIPVPTANYSHPFPTPPSSPPTVQGSSHHHHQQQQQQHHHHQTQFVHLHNNQHARSSIVPSSNGSCRKDLNTCWNPSSGPVSDVRSGGPTAMFSMEQLAPYVTS